MPLLFFSWVNTQRSLPQARCKMARLFAYLDDSYIICRLARVGAVHELLRHWLWVHSGISLHAGKQGVEQKRNPTSWVCDVAAHVAGCRRAWRSLCASTQAGVQSARCPHPEFVKKLLQNENCEHKVFLDRIPVSPLPTQEFAQAHDEWECFCRMLSVHPDCGAQEQSSLLWEGGIGFGSARGTMPAAHFASQLG